MIKRPERKNGLYESTVIIITAKHGQSPIDPHRVLRIPGDNASLESPATLLGDMVAGSSEDDVSLIWLKNQDDTLAAAEMLSKNGDKTGGGEIFAGNSMTLLFDDAQLDPRTPDIAVAPNVGASTPAVEKGCRTWRLCRRRPRCDAVDFKPWIANGNHSRSGADDLRCAHYLTAASLAPTELEGVRKDKTPELPGLIFTEVDPN